MTRLRRFAIAALAAAAVTVGSLATVPTASAMPRSCTVNVALAHAYRATGNVFYALGDYGNALYYYGKASALYEACS